MLVSSPFAVFEPLPAHVRDSLGLWVFDADGRVVEPPACNGQVAHCEQFDGELLPDRARLVRERADGGHVVVTYPGDLDASWLRMVAALLDADVQRERLEVDLESMSASSLGLLEEVAMVGDVMTELSTGATEEEIVERGLKSLLVGASAERAAYYRWEPERGGFGLLVDVEYEEQGRRVRSRAIDADRCVPRAGVLERASAVAGTVVLEAVASCGEETRGPESRARRQVLATPVTHGEARLLGVLVLADKRATSYSNVRTFGSHETKMAGALASMLAAVLGARKSAELGKELMLAKTIQQQILPDRPADVPGFELAGRCETSGAVGGDYFDFLPMSDGRVLCVVADVSGHNLASGMVMVGARASLRVLAAQECDVARLFDGLADAIFDDLSRTERFITVAGVALDATSDTVEIVNAGHNDTMIYRAATGAVERLPSENAILGFLPGMRHDAGTARVAAGDVILVYTDGVTEALGPAEEMFGEERLAAVLAGAAGSPADAILAAVYDAVAAHTGGSAGGDDVTAIVIKRGGTEEEGAR